MSRYDEKTGRSGKAARPCAFGAAASPSSSLSLRERVRVRAGSLPVGVRFLCIAVLAGFAFLASSSAALAGMMVAADDSMVAAIDSGMSGGMSGQTAPAERSPGGPLAQDHESPSFLYGTANNPTGAGSPSPTSAPSAGLTAHVHSGLSTAQDMMLISRLTLSSRISLPSPLEDRFFRPPR